MFNVLLISQENKTREELRTGLTRYGCVCSFTPPGPEVAEQLARQSPDLVLVEMASHSSASEIEELLKGITQAKRPPVMALISRELFDHHNGYLDMTDDFVIGPYDLEELGLRIKRLLHKTGQKDTGELIACGDLLINQAKCEVTLSGKMITLTFVEFELLRFLASNKGRVFTRDALLNKVWGYDYYGGDRTVDVHVRRLRSKIEDSTHIFIDTVRNIGYKFREDSKIP